jgi:hypothetical protein
VSFDELIRQGLEVGSQLGPAAVVAALVSALLMLVFGWPWRATRPIRARVGGVVSVALGFAVGCWWLDIRPNWPPQEDQDRLLFILLPAVIAIEILAALIEARFSHLQSEIPSSKSEDRASSIGFRVSGLAWLLRFLVAAAATPILLYGTTYVSDDAGPGTRQWTPQQTWMIFASLAASLLAVWLLLAWLIQQSPGRAALLAVAIACGGTAVIMMMSGYASGGPLAMPLAGGVVGALAVSMALRNADCVANTLGFAVVGLFALILMGHFFGVLTWTNAALLFFAPVLVAFPELPPFRRVNPNLRAGVGIVLTTVPVVIAMALAMQKMAEQSPRPSPGDTQEPTLDDYMNFGK